MDIAVIPYALVERLQKTGVQHHHSNGEAETAYPDGPGTVFNEKAEWEHLLADAGWKPLGGRQDGVTDWCRPGKEQGLSATTGFCGDRLYVFTTNAEPLEAGLSYDKFQFHTVVNHDGDFKSSASELASAGYTRPAELQFTEIKEEKLCSLTPSSHVSTELLLFPGFVQTFAELHAVRSHRSDLRAGAVVGIIFQSWLMGRKVMLEDGTRPNIAGMLLGPSSYGKTSAIDTLDLVMSHLGWESAMHRKFKSWQGLEDAIAATPNLLYIQEESQDLLKSITNPRESSHLYQLSSTIKELLTASKSSFRSREGAAQKGVVAPPPVDQPHLSILLTGLASEVWSAMTDQLLRDGFAGRLWPIELTEMAERNLNPHVDHELFELVLQHCREWQALTPVEMTPIESTEITTSRLSPIPILRTDRSRLLADQFAADCDKLIRSLAKTDDAGASVWGRAHELMCTLELLITGSASAAGRCVDEETTLKAIEIVEKTLTQKVFRMETRGIFDNENKRLQSVILKVLNRRANKEQTRVSWRETYRSSHISPVQKFNEVMASLLISGEVVSDAKVSLDCSRIDKHGSFVCLPKYAEEGVDKGKSTIKVGK